MSLSNASDRMSPVSTGGRCRPADALLYAATLFVSALLLFSIQPMFAKMVLPKLGGAPAVWSVAMVFFQTVLLAGYAYAHLLNRVLLPRWAAMFHLALLGVTATMLPIAIAPGWGTPPSDGTALWLFGLFAVSIGLAVLHAVGQRAVAAELVFGERTQAGRQSLCALRRLQPRLVRRAVRLSRHHRAVSHAEDADGGVVDRICTARHSPEPSSACSRRARTGRCTGRGR